ncbi:DUF1641 domain-containing protein [Amphritea sp.]|uniref:DUF1641 domain-containing protein n=1 Tax=Amphritea sp. TaxID=1872502 RepID=UPI0025C5E930|nr:DUF1641 domain-containing protein [Amphritea sp.]
MNITNNTELPLEQTNSIRELSPAAQAGLEELIDKVEPLLAGRRLNRIVDVMSITADVVDMTDDYMIEKLCKVYEEAIGGIWNAGNLARMAGSEVRNMEEPPSTWGLVKMARDPEVRRGLAFMIMMAKGLGRQTSEPLPEE